MFEELVGTDIQGLVNTCNPTKNNSTLCSVIGLDLTKALICGDLNHQHCCKQCLANPSPVHHSFILFLAIWLQPHEEKPFSSVKFCIWSFVPSPRQANILAMSCCENQNTFYTFSSTVLFVTMSNVKRCLVLCLSSKSYYFLLVFRKLLGHSDAMSDCPRRTIKR